MAVASFRKLAAKCSSAVNAHPAAAVVVFTAGFWWLMIARACIKPLWHDEIYTLVLSTTPSLRAMWAAQLAGLDLMPPLNPVLTHILAQAVGINHVSLRLPAMLGVWTTAVVSFVLVRQRSDSVTAINALLLPLLLGSAAVAYEARGYGLCSECLRRRSSRGPRQRRTGGGASISRCWPSAPERGSGRITTRCSASYRSRQVRQPGLFGRGGSTGGSRWQSSPELQRSFPSCR